MRKRLFGAVVLCGCLGLSLAGMALANGALEGDTPAIMVSPSTIVLAKVATVTVHTNVPAILVDPERLALNDVAPTLVYADNLGHVAAKFAVADLNLSPGQVTMTLTGILTDGPFSASDDVTVK